MQRLQNGIDVVTNSDEYNPAEQLAASFLQADVVIRVASKAARDALVKRDGMAVARMDLGGLIEVWDADLSTWSIGIQHTEFTGNVTIQQNTPFGTGTLTRDTGQTRYGTDVTSPGNDLITLPGKRMYAIHIRARLGVPAAGQTFFSLRWNDNQDEIDSGDMEPGKSATTISIPNLYVPSDRTLKLFFISGAATGSALTTRVRITRNG